VGAKRVDVPDDSSVLPMPTTLRTAAVARWVGRGNGPSRVTGASACPAAGDCYKNNYPHNSRCSEDKHCTAGISHSTTNGATTHFPCQIRISSAKGGPGRDRMRTPSATDAFRFTHGQTNSCTGSDVADMAVYGTLTFRPSYGREVQEGEAVSVGRRRARRSLSAVDSQRRPTGSRTMHRLLLGLITNYRGESGARRKRCHRDSGLSLAIFLFTGLPPKEKNNNGMTCTRISPRRSHVRIEYGIGIGPGEPCGRPIGILMPFTRLCRGTTAMQR